MCWDDYFGTMTGWKIAQKYTAVNSNMSGTLFDLFVPDSIMFGAFHFDDIAGKCN